MLTWMLRLPFYRGCLLIGALLGLAGHLYLLDQRVSLLEEMQGIDDFIPFQMEPDETIGACN